MQCTDEPRIWPCSKTWGRVAEANLSVVVGEEALLELQLDRGGRLGHHLGQVLLERPRRRPDRHRLLPLGRVTRADLGLGLRPQRRPPSSISTHTPTSKHQSNLLFVKY